MNLFLTNLSKSLLVLNFIIVTFSTVANAMEINGSQYFLTDENGVPLGVDPDFGSVFVGSTKTQTHSICASCVGPTCSDINYTKINNISMSGSSEFSSTPDSCRQAILVPGKCCSHTVYFAPLSAGTKSASLVLTYTLMNSVTSPTGTVVTPVNDITIVPYTGTGVVPLPISLPPIASTNSCSVTGHSSVNIDLLSLQESIPLVGIPFTLSYSSDRFRKGFSYSTKSLGLGGWSPSVVHRYDYLKHIVYFGNGGLRPIQAKTIAGGYYVSNEAGSELYYFNSNGLHTQTKNAVTGSIIYNFNYDYSGRILSIVDGFGNSTVFEYSGFETTVTSPYGQASILTLDDNGFLASVTNPNKETYQLTNNTSGFLLSFQKPGGQKSVVTYDQNGYVIKDQGAGGDFVSFIRNLNSITGIQNVTSSTALNRQTLFSTSATSSSSSTHVVTTPDGSVRNYSSADQGNNTSTDGYGNVYNSTKVQDPRFNWMAPFESSSVYQVPNSNISVSIQRTQSAQLADSNNPLSVISLSSSVTLQDDSSRVFTKTYDSSQKLLTFTSPLNRTLYQTLNSMGGISSFQNGNLNQIDFSYDNRGRFSGVTQGDRKTNFLYDDYGNLATVTDAVGRTIQYKYDKANRLTEQVLPDGQIIAMTYDANGNRTSITPPGRTAHTFSYNLFESISSYMPPALKSQVLGATTYEYNLDQQLTKVNRPDGTNIIMNYGSASGLLESMDTSGGSYTFQYLPKSNLVSLISSPDGNTLSYQYAGNIPLSVISSGAISSQMQYSYNVDGTLSGMSVSGKENSQSKINISYDKDGLISGVGNISFVLNNVGSINKTSIGQITESIAYDNFGETISDAFNLEKRSLYGISYNRDKLGRIMSIKKIKDDDKKEISYEYDQRGRLTRVFNHKEHLLREYKYDSNGNRIEALTEHGRVKAEYDAQDRLIRYGKNQYTYNENGELAQKIQNDDDNDNVTSYTYDVFGNLKTVIIHNKKKIEYVIDGKNRRIGKKLNGKLVQGYVYQSQTQIAGELDGDGNLIKRFVYGSKANVPDYMTYQGKEYRIISNSVGTPELIVEASSGKVVQKFEFDEFGVKREAERKFMIPFGFAGGLYDEDTKLLRFGARDYDPEIGRWTAKDPILFDGGDTNLFGYVAQDPINAIDPTGLYGTNSCSYYDQACKDKGGSYLCTIAPAACNTFPKPSNPSPNDPNAYEGFNRCTRQCLQDCDQHGLPTGAAKSGESCGASSEAGSNGGGAVACHASCFAICGSGNNPVFGGQ